MRAFFSIPHSKVEFISRPNAPGYVRLLRLSLPYSSTLFHDPRFSFRGERLFALTHPLLTPLPPFRGNLSSGVQVAPKSGMGRFYSWPKTASREILKKEWRRNLMLFRKMYKIYKIVWINSHFERVFILVHMWIHLRQTKDGKMAFITSQAKHSF